MVATVDLSLPPGMQELAQLAQFRRCRRSCVHAGRSRGTGDAASARAAGTGAIGSRPAASSASRATRGGTIASAGLRAPPASAPLVPGATLGDTTPARGSIPPGRPGVRGGL